MSTKVRGIRGAITVLRNSKQAIIEGTNVLLKEMLLANEVAYDEISSIIFTVTRDLDQEFPAKAARMQGLSSTPLLCMNEIPVRNSLKKCIRILIQYNTTKSQDEIKHIYLRGAVKLRPDLKK